VFWTFAAAREERRGNVNNFAAESFWGHGNARQSEQEREGSRGALSKLTEREKLRRKRGRPKFSRAKSL